MKRNKKAFIILVISVVAVLVVGAVATTYAWFLSRYARDYEFILDSMSDVIIKYEVDLDYASGNISTASNVLIPATEKNYESSGAISQGAMTALDVFDVDTLDPAHTGKVATAAQAVKYTATGAYWTGDSVKKGDFTPQLHAYTNVFLASSDLSDHLETFSEETAVTEENLLSLLTEEADEVSAVNRLIARNDLVAQGEISYIMVIDYLGKTFLYYNGSYYVLGVQTGNAFVLPEEAESNSELRYWHTPTDLNSTVDDEQISDGSYFHLLPNTEFTFTLYVFMARTDESRDYEINGKRISLFASLTVEEVSETPAV